jgi:hypothetical protein
MLSLFIVCSALFNGVIEALNLVLEKYLAEIQLPGNITHLLSIPQSSTQINCAAKAYFYCPTMN